MKKTIYSATKPTGILTLGNYIGAVNNWKKMESENDCYFCVANLHAHTIDLSAEFVMEKTLQQFATFLACGLDPNKSIIYIQSMVPEHSELMWLLNCNTMMGEANRMTQYKDHVAKGKTSITTALFTYPILMAADILLYNAQIVPVGDDQVQHVELTRDIANRFNHKFGDTFVVPKAVVPTIGARIKGLQDPTSKMGKSNEDKNNVILLTDTDEEITKKIKRAVTDSLANIAYDEENQPGVSNLLTIISACENKNIDTVVEELKGQNYGALKQRAINAAINVIAPIREKFNYYMSNKDELLHLAEIGAEKAKVVAKETLARAKKAMGIL